MTNKCQELGLCLSNTAKKCLNPKSLFFVAKLIFKSFFGIRNLKTLFYRFCTIFMVLAHYQLVERIDQEKWVHNEEAFLKFIIVWHLIFMHFKAVEETRRKKNEEHLHMIVAVCGFLGICTFITFLTTPFLSWYDSDLTRLQSSYYTWRYIMMLLYILMNTCINVFPLVNNFMFFLSDGLILSQLTSLYLFNEFSMSAMLTALPFLFVLQNHGLIKGIKNFARDEQNSKLSFTRLIGRHDAVFLFVIYTIFTFMFNLVDMISTNYIFGVNFWYTIYALYLFGKLMDNKKISTTLKIVSFLSVVIYAALYCYTLQYHNNPFPERKFPLYNPNPEPLNNGDDNITQDVSAKPEAQIPNTNDQSQSEGGF